MQLQACNFIKKGPQRRCFPKKIAKSLFFKKLQAPHSSILLKKDSGTGFPVNFAKFLRTSIL